MTPADLAQWPGVTLGPTVGERLAAGPDVRTPPPAEATEKAFDGEVVALAKACGWKTYHTHNSRKSEAGFPDRVFVRDRVVFAELKTDTGRLSAAQLNWLDSLKNAGAEAYLWRPSDWPRIIEVLR